MDVVIPIGVTSIGKYAFYECTSFTSVSIPNSVTSIGSDAFYNVLNIVYSGEASGLPWGARSVNGYMDGYFVYEGSAKSQLIACSHAAIGEINIPNTVKNIGTKAFSGCSLLTSVTIPNSVTTIGNNIFSGCSNLSSITINSSTLIGKNYSSYDNLYSVFGEQIVNIVLGDNITNIGSYAFYGCSGITSIAIPSSITSVGSEAFGGCPNLTSVTINSSKIMEKSFSNNDNLKNIFGEQVTTYVLGEDITNISSWAFSGCSSLTSITIPKSVIKIGSGAFSACTSLSETHYIGDIASWCAIKFGSSDANPIYYSGNLYIDEVLVSDLVIPESTTSIGAYAFTNCSSITSVSIPDSVTSIGQNAFSGCTSLPVVDNIRYAGTYLVEAIDKTLSTYIIRDGTRWIGWNAFYGCLGMSCITIPNSVIHIEVNAFFNCCNLISATIGNGVMNIEDNAFSYCEKLNSITILGCTPPICKNYVFSFTPQNKTLIVPSNSMDSYKSTASWGSFTSYESVIEIEVLSSDTTKGEVQINQDVDCDSVAIISASANNGYEFTQWSDGNTDNPRTIKLTQDTTLTAEFGLTYSGKCGDDLYWAYSNKEVKITGTGAMYNYTDNTMPWSLLRDSIKTVRVGNNATSIGAYAFANTPKLAELYIGTNVEDIGANAFAGCRRLYDIYCYPTYPPFAESNSFANYSVYLYIPCDYQRSYKLDLVWKMFLYIECIGSEDVVVPDNEVTVSPNYEDATFIWPVTDGADTYSLVITKDDITFCTLIFNAQGQLVSIAFKPRRQNAPAAEGTTSATYAEMTANGFRFTVTGLNEGSAYAYTLTVRNAANTVLETYTGEFTTLSNTPTGINESADEDAHAHGQVEKILRDGQVLILRNGETYDMMGQRL